MESASVRLVSPRNTATRRAAITEAIEERKLLAALAPGDVPPEYNPTVPGLTLQYTGKDHGHPASWTRTWETTILDGEQVLLKHEVEVNTYADESDTTDEYFRLSGGLLTEMQEQTTYTNGGGAHSIRYPSTLPANTVDRAPGWSQVWTDVPLTSTDGDLASDAIGDSGLVKVKLAVVGIKPVRLSNGLYFSRAIVTRSEMWLDIDLTRGDFDHFRRHGIQTTWFVQGIGEVKCTYEVKYAVGGPRPQRRELSAIPDWAKYLTLSDGILHVPGTNVADTITFAVKNSTLTCYRNGVPDSVSLTDVRGIVINGSDGNDVIDARKLLLPVTISGGAGDDLILGSRSNDSILAGDGNDTVRAGKGDDTLIGGAGSDLLVGSAGTNHFEAADGAIDILDARGSRTSTGIWDTAQDQLRGQLTLS